MYKYFIRFCFVVVFLVKVSYMIDFSIRAGGEYLRARIWGRVNKSGVFFVMICFRSGGWKACFILFFSGRVWGY